MECGEMGWVQMCEDEVGWYWGEVGWGRRASMLGQGRVVFSSCRDKSGECCGSKLIWDGHSVEGG